MEILRSTGVATAKAVCEQSIGSLVIYSTLEFNAWNTEKIKIWIETPNERKNIEITKAMVSLKKFVALMTYGDDAITSFRASVGEAFETVAVIELCEHGAIKLEGNEKLKIELEGLTTTATFVIDGIEEPDTSTEVYTTEEKIISSETPVITVNTETYDVVILDDIAQINEVQFKYDNGRTCTYTLRELRALSHDNDPFAYVRKSGTVECSFVGILQLPLKGVNGLTIKKTGNVAVNLLMRHDEDLKAYRN